LVRAGWSRLGTHEDAVLREFAQMADTLTSSPIATLMGRDVRDHATELLRDLRIM
jgi:hypothetical protein